MLTSLALIFLAGLAMAALCSLLRLPRIIGMLFTGILLGPYVLGLLDPSILAISADLRQMALIIILIKAGLSLDLGDLRRVGRPAVLMSFLPASFEILAYILFAPMLLGITRLEAAVVMILLALCVRAVGVLLALAGTRLDWKDRLFCVIAYQPKAASTGRHRFGAAGNGSALRSPGALGGSAGDPYHSAAGSHRHRQYLPPPAASRRLIFPFSPNKKPELSAQESSGFLFYFTVLQDLHLQRLHGIEGVFLGFGGHTGTAAGPDRHRHFRTVGLEQRHNGKHTDVGAEADDLDGIGTERPDILSQLQAAEAALFKDGAAHREILELCRELPAVAAPQAVHYREVSALLGLEVVDAVGILGEDHLPAVTHGLDDALLDSRDNGLSFRCAQRAIDKVLLHIHNDKKIHRDSSCFIKLPKFQSGRRPPAHRGTPARSV